MNLMNLLNLAQAPAGMEEAAAAAAAVGIVMVIIVIVLVLTMVISMWVLFQKAGKPGWAAIIPIYNLVVMLEIIGRPIWWIVMMFIPLVSIVFSILIYIDLCKSFGKSPALVVGLIFLPFIFFPYMAFTSEYQGPAAA